MKKAIIILAILMLSAGCSIDGACGGTEREQKRIIFLTGGDTKWVYCNEEPEIVIMGDEYNSIFLLKMCGATYNMRHIVGYGKSDR